MMEVEKEKLYTAVLAALNAWSDISADGSSLLESLMLVQERRKTYKSTRPTFVRRATNEILLEGLDGLRKVDEMSEALLRERFLDRRTVAEVALGKNLSQDRIKRLQQKAVQKLAQILYERDQMLRQEMIQEIEYTLPQIDTANGYLFGVAPLLETMLNLLRDPQSHWVIALTGIGGIGKTALALAVARRLIPDFQYEKVVWVHVNVDANLTDVLRELGQSVCNPQTELSSVVEIRKAIHLALKDSQNLIVIDNLENPDLGAQLFQMASEWANPSKFLLTTRIRPPILASVQTLTVTELPLNAVTALIRERARVLGLKEFEASLKHVAAHIYRVVGGNPLAIKLVMGLATMLPLEKILTDLTQAHIGEVEKMYRYIFWQSWQTISPPAQALLEMMPMVAETGAEIEQLYAITQLQNNQLLPAITELVSHSLLDIRDSAGKKLYSIHSLTRSFLQVEIIHWVETGEDEEE